MSYQRVLRRSSGKWGRRSVDDDEMPSRRLAPQRAQRAGDEDESEWDVSEWSNVLYTSRIRHSARLR